MATASRAEKALRLGAGRSGDAAKIIAFPERERDPTPLALARLVEQEILPRLLLTHRRFAPRAVPATSPGPVAPRKVAVPGTIAHAEISRFAQAAVVEEAEHLLVRLESWRTQGFDDQTLCLDLLAPAAKLLGFMWAEDLCGFTDVTVGLVRLQQVLHALTERVAPAEGDPDRNALFAVVPGEQHVFGMLMAADAFRRTGWRVATAEETSRQSLIRLVAGEVFDLVGLSVVQDCDTDEVRSLIAGLRAASLNPEVRISVGGRFFDLHPDLIVDVGADSGGEDARASATSAERLVSKRLAQT